MRTVAGYGVVTEPIWNRKPGVTVTSVPSVVSTMPHWSFEHVFDTL
jgi:hypothetical protein